MLPSLDPGSDRAVFRQIADHLREAIKRGDLREGEKLPSEAALMKHYGVARGTVRQALQLLQSEGVAAAEHGRGVFVRPRPPVRRLASDRFARRHRERGQAAFMAESEASGRRPSVDMLTVTQAAPPLDIAERLKLDEGTATVVRRRRYLHDGHPVEVATSYLPADIATGTKIGEPDPGPGGIYARLEELGHRLDHFDEQIEARMPTAEESRVLALASGVPVFHLIRTAYDTDGRPVEVCDTVMAADSFVLSYTLPAS
ncbi:GntR family transcriptional regulator [Kineococcus xinjiangensis]|uniref:GntR family transcriptional regulator n=1 Tax=Kineococcus xinjiangensis TaxID=512762 RepID=A0A2S6IFF5_9ACTN|nr:GntR family transcriptional regulator [Kineococcus xinjiangensis]PPK92952.1 GntR family transcriptional regulator [Kineococcus xinjiangensis]